MSCLLQCISLFVLILVSVAQIAWFNEKEQQISNNNSLRTGHAILLLIEVTIQPNSVGEFQILSSRRRLGNLKYYQADVCWQISNLSSRRCDVTTATLVFINSMLRNTSLSHKPRWQ